MRIIITKDYEAMSRMGAKEIVDLVRKNSHCILGLATGSTPMGMYKQLVQYNKEGLVDFSHVSTVNLDEYRGLGQEDPQSYRYFMNKNLFAHINICLENTFIPNGMAQAMEEECRSYDRRVAQLGGIDLQVLGIGHNGHIGFNEPSEYLSMGTHLTNLKKETIEANARFFSSMEEVPTQAITMGLGGIMKAKRILLLASGEEKADIVSRLAEGKISTELPASILQVHQDVLVIVDEKAGALLRKRYSAFVEIA